MSKFKNVTDVDLEVQVDGRRIFAGAGQEFAIADEFDFQLTHQPAFELAKSKKSAAPAEATTEGDN